MTSTSTLGSTRISMQFDLDREINGAARDAQAAINAARSLLPTGLPRNPTYHKVNPADAPIMIMALTSDTMTRGQLYIDLSVVMDRTPTIRGSLHEVQRTLMISSGLVILVVFLFLRNLRATLIPSVAVPVSVDRNSAR